VTGLYESYDSSYMDFDVSTKILRLVNGIRIWFTQLNRASDPVTGVNLSNQWLPTTIADRNGNYISITYTQLTNTNREYAISTIVDTLGRTVEFHYTNNRLTDIGQTRSGTWHSFMTIGYQDVTVHTSFSSPLAVDGPSNGSDVWVPYLLTYPTGHYYVLDYTSYAQAYLIEKWVPAVQGQSTSPRRVSYTRYNLPSYTGQSFPSSDFPPVSDTSQTDSPPFTERREWAESWNLNSSGVPQPVNYTYYFATDGSYSTVTDRPGASTAPSTPTVWRRSTRPLRAAPARHQKL